jgi:hypothetical protein
MRSPRRGVGRGHFSNSSRGVNPNPPRGRGQQPANMAARVPGTDAPVSRPPLSAHHKTQLLQLKSGLDTFKPTENQLNQLTQFMQQLHQTQWQLKLAVRDHGQESPVPGLCQALLRLVTDLDAALQGPPDAARHAPTREPSRNSLPLVALSKDQVEQLSLGVSALAYNANKLPFPPGQLSEAKTALAGINAKLMRRTLALGGSGALDTDQRLNICNMVRRLVVAGVLGNEPFSHVETQKFCTQVFKCFGDWAAGGHVPASPHDLGKCASQIETMFDYKLGGVTDDGNADVLAEVLKWLLHADALGRIESQGAAVALNGIASLVKRLLECGKIKVQDRALDSGWGRLIHAIYSFDAVTMVGQDGRPLAGFANLLRIMIDVGLVEQWLSVVPGQDQGQDQAQAPELARQFAIAYKKVVAGVHHPTLGEVCDLQTVSSLFIAIKAGEKKRQEGWTPPEQWFAREDLAKAAEVVLQALPQGRLESVQDQQAVGGLFSGLGFLWQEGLISVRGKGLDCLHKLLNAVTATDNWERRHVLGMVSILLKLLDDKHVNEERLNPICDVLMGFRKMGWRRQDIVDWAKRPTPKPRPTPLPLVLDAGQPHEQAKPGSVTRLVGETTLAQIQMPASAPASQPGNHGLAGLGLDSPTEWICDPDGFMQPARTRDRAEPQWKTVPIASSSAAVQRTTTNTTSTTTTSSTNTSASTRTTTTVVTAAHDQPAAVKAEWLRLITLPNGDPSAKLAALAKRHPECLTWVDRNGRDTLWHLVTGHKLDSLYALVSDEFIQYRPSISKSKKKVLVEVLSKNASLVAPWLLLKLFGVEVKWSSLSAPVAVAPAPSLNSGLTSKFLIDFSNAVFAGDALTLSPLLQQDAISAMSEITRRSMLEAVVLHGHVQVLKLLLALESFRTLVGMASTTQPSLAHIALILLSTFVPTVVNGQPRFKPEHLHAKHIFSLLLTEPALRVTACLPNNAGQDALLLAISHQLWPQVEEMLQFTEFYHRMQMLNAERTDLLRYAVTRGHVELVRILNRFSEVRALYAPPGSELLPLELAVVRGFAPIAKLLLEDHSAYDNLNVSLRPS